MELPVPTDETDAFVDAAMGQLLWQEPQKLGWWVPFKIQILRLARWLGVSVLASKTVTVLAIKVDGLSLNPRDPHGEKEEQTSHVVLWLLCVLPGVYACMRTRTHKLIVKQMMHYFINHHLQFFSPLLVLGHAAFITAIETLRHEPKKLSCHSCLWSSTELNLGHLATGRHGPIQDARRTMMLTVPSGPQRSQACLLLFTAPLLTRSSPHWRPSALYTSLSADI